MDLEHLVPLLPRRTLPSASSPTPWAATKSFSWTAGPGTVAAAASDASFAACSSRPQMVSVASWLYSLGSFCPQCRTITRFSWTDSVTTHSGRCLGHAPTHIVDLNRQNFEVFCLRPPSRRESAGRWARWQDEDSLDIGTTGRPSYYGPSLFCYLVSCFRVANRLHLVACKTCDWAKLPAATSAVHSGFPVHVEMVRLHLMHGGGPRQKQLTLLSALLSAKPERSNKFTSLWAKFCVTQAAAKVVESSACSGASGDVSWCAYRHWLTTNSQYSRNDYCGCSVIRHPFLRLHPCFQRCQRLNNLQENTWF